MKIKPLVIKQYKAKKGETIINLLINLANELVVIKKKVNEIVEYISRDKVNKCGTCDAPLKIMKFDKRIYKGCNNVKCNQPELIRQ